MTQEDKKLLLKDIAARLPYATKVFYEYVDDLDKKTYGYSLTLNTWCIDEFNADKAVVKPYLRPMSSMTEEEKQELYKFDDYESISWVDSEEICFKNITISFDLYTRIIDWLNTHHFNYRGLIEKGLAIEVTEENNPYKE